MPFEVIPDGVAVYLFRRKAQEIEFLQLRRAESEELLPESWQTIYGGAEDGENAMDAARRELLEETGIVPQSMYLIEFIETFYFRPRNAIMMLPVFAAEAPVDCSIVLNNEHDAFRWVSEHELNSHFVWRSQREALRVVLETISGRGTRLDVLRV